MVNVDALVAEYGGIRLDIGCGANKQAGWVGMDWQELPGVDIIHDVESYPWPLPDESVLVAFASHLVEHINPARGGFLKFMDEVWRVLRPGGRLYVKDVFCVGSQLAPGERSAMEAFDQLWGCVRSRTISESEAAITNAGLLVTKAAELVQVGTARLTGAMFTLDKSLGLRATDLGRQFSPRAMSPPIEFGEILAIKPSPP